MTPLSSSRGQLALPMLAVLVLFGFFLAGYIRLCRQIYWQMRMDVAADAAALSASRAQAEMLNSLSIANLGINLFLKKVQLGGKNFGEMSASSIPAFVGWKNGLKGLAWGFKTFPAGVGRKVSQLNGAEPAAPYFPFPMDSHLLPQTVHIFIRVPTPPYLIQRIYEGAYYARAWKPNVIEAQPVHKTTWLVSHQRIRSIATAQVWLDAQSGRLSHNGGFPREKESLLRGIGIQGWPAQFNARLLPAPVIPIKSLLKVWSRHG